MNPQRDNVKAGIFVLAGIILAVTVIIVLSDFSAFFAKRQEVKVYYALSDGLQGLKPGARVTIGGQPAGEVLEIKDYKPSNEPDNIIGSVIKLSLDSSVKLHWNARIELERPPLGSNTTINIASIGGGKRYDIDQKIAMTDLLEHYPFLQSNTNDNDMVKKQREDQAKEILARLPEGTIPGRIAGSAIAEAFARNVGIEETQRRQIQDVIANASILTGDLRNLTAALSTRGGTVAEVIDNVRDATGTLKNDLPKLTASAQVNLDNIGKIIEDAKISIANLNKATADAEAVIADTRKRSEAWLTNIDNATKNADESLVLLRDLIKSKDPAVREAIDNIVSVTKTAKEQTMKQVEVALDKGTQAMENLRVATEEVKTLVIGQRPVLERAFANAGLTTAQLKLAAIEVRRSPWRLLYSPGDEELNTDNLYDAARSFALAASTLDSAAQGLRAIAEKEPGNKDQIQRMLSDLEKLFGKYKEAEDEFWKALKAKQ